MLRTSLFPFALVLVVAGCSSDPTPAAATDAGTDTPVDSGTDTKPTDTGAPPITCEQAVPSDFACVAPTKATGKTVCTEAMLQELADKCLAADISVPSACAEWKTAYADCATCVGAWSWEGIPGKIYPDDYLCYWAIMDDACGKNVNCMFSCEESVCADCDRTPGSDGESEAYKCYTAQEKEGSKCWDVAAKEGTACFTTFDTKPCDVSEIYKETADLTNLKKQVVHFLRGACRDNGSWANADSAGDAGVPDADAASEASTDSATDSAVTDSAVTDSAADDATSDAADAD
jgi:hypothetical protein